MSDIVLESIRASVMGLILAYLVWIGRKEQLHRQPGWSYIVAGTGLVFLGGLFDITDNFDELNRFVVIGDTVTEAFIEKAVGFLLGYILILAGFLYWLPLVGAVRRAEEQLKSHGEELERQVDIRTRELREAEQRLQTLVSNLPVIAFALDREGVFTLSEGKGLEALGREPGQVVGRSIFDVYNSVPQILGGVRSALAGEGTSLSVEIQGVPFDARYEPLRDQNGQVIGVVGVAHDITERKRVEEEVAWLNRQNELILSSAGEGIYGLDLEGKTTFVNPAAARMIGWEIEDIIGRSQHDVLHHSKPDGSPYPREECPIYAAFKDGEVHQVSSEVFWRKDGASFPVEYTSSPIRDERGELAGAVVTFRDITERRQAEEEIENLAKFPSENPNPVLRLARDGTIMYANAASQALLVNGGKSGLFASGDWSQIVIGALDSGTSRDVEVALGERAFSFVIAPVPEGGYVNLYGQDITERKEIERMKDDFVSIVSHELRTPLTSIKGFLELLHEDSNSFAEEQQQFLEAITRNTDRLDRLVNDLLDISRLEAGMVIIETSEFDFREVVAQVVSEMHSDIDAKELEISTDGMATLAKVQGDRGRVLQILANLLSNAIKYSPTQASVEINAAVHGDGPGFSK